MSQSVGSGRIFPEIQNREYPWTRQPPNKHRERSLLSAIAVKTQHYRMALCSHGVGEWQRVRGEACPPGTRDLGDARLAPSSPRQIGRWSLHAASVPVTRWQVMLLDPWST